MRFRLLRRRLTISAPRVSVRSAMPWPLRWAVLAIMLGFCGAIALWAFEFGKNLAGLEPHAREEVLALREQLAQMRDERDKAQSVANTSGSLLTAERATQERLLAQVHQLEQDNRSLRDDLGFFEKLIPANSQDDVGIRGLQAEVLAGQQLRWQILVIQPVKAGPEFKGRLEMVLSGTLAGKPWEMPLPQGPVALQFRQYRRLEGVLELPAQAVVKQVTARVLDANGSRAVQTLKL
ncbi:hypothetical protein PSQ20_08040 [Curvibacter sp. RS43]|uniref:DNA-binding protein n=1 Tax=Curvibacter microcysteis TaxID=3026419 RepID=A0ABT5MK63_9BURK|nr:MULTISPECIES: DUF6776 family protein [unclassified Curvibacter]MDD0810281.1 hypothetical protein [Curvibacter sp. RS43]MDD0816968.1 hypothetical protein [Curvibacter sp. HBC28]